MGSRPRPAMIVLVALVLAACGGARDVADDPRQALRDAFERTAAWDGTSVTVRIDADVDALLAADESDELTEDQARAILDGQATVRSYTGDDLADRSDDEGEFLVATGDTTVIHVITVGMEQLFVRSEVREAVERFGDERVAGELDAAELQAQQFGIDFASEFFAGAWLSLRGAQELSDMYGAAAGLETPEPEEIESFLAELEASIDRFLSDVTIEHLGRDAAGEHLRVVATADRFGQLAVEIVDRASALAALQFGMPAAALADELQKETAEAPDVDIPIEVWLDRGVVRQVGFDVVEFARRNGDTAEVEVPPDVDRFVLLAEFEEFGGGVDLPKDAIEVDLTELMGRFMGHGFGGFDA